MSAQRQLHLNAFLMSSGHHEAAWRLPQSDPFANFDLGHWRNLAQIAERGRFDSLFLADGPALRQNARYRPAGALAPADGLNVMPAVLPAGLAAFVEHVIPILQRRGLFRTEYAGATLREHYGLPRPDSQFAAARLAPPRRRRPSPCQLPPGSSGPASSASSGGRVRSCGSW
jgi:hypothetical protein